MIYFTIPRFQYIITTILLVGCLALQSQSYDHPFLRTQVLKVKETNLTAIPALGNWQVSEVIAYTDALNRTTQTVARQASPNNNDMVGFNVYSLDESHSISYQGYSTGDGDGHFRGNPVDEQTTFYQAAVKVYHTAYPYSEVEFDGSPMRRPVEVSSPGYGWRYLASGNGNTVKTGNLVNQTGEIRLWTINTDNTVSTSSFYPEKTLIGNDVQDEDRHQVIGGRRVIKYTDIAGRLIVKKEILSDTKALLTYYVYDDFGNLRFIIPPKASSSIPGSGSWNSASCQSSNNDLLFWNMYDEKQRLTQKKTPGKAVEYFVYDKLDRVIMRQDGNLRVGNQWYFYKYDILGRVIQEGLTTDNQAFPDLQTYVNGPSVQFFEEKSPVTQALPHGYTDQSYPGTSQGSSSTILKLFYYDQYPDFVSPSSIYSFKPQETGFYQTDEEVFNRLQGQITTIKTKILESEDNWLVTANYYDIRGRLIQVVSDNHLGGLDVVCNSYSFDGKLLKSRIIHNYNSQNLTHETLQYRYDYDGGGRILNIYQQYCTTCDELIYANYKYNELGQLIEKNLHMPKGGRGYLQSIDYAYNPRGWLTRINQANLTNLNSYIQNEITLADFEEIDGMRLDSIHLGLRVITDHDGKNSLVLSFRDKKNLRVTEIGNPGNSRTIDVPETSTKTFGEAVPEEQEVYNALSSYSDHEYHFSLGGLTFDENAETGQLLDSITFLIDAQLPAQGVTEAVARETASSLIRTFFSEKIGIVFFNEDNNDLFGMDIHYSDGPNLRYNGNIGSIDWQNKTHDPGQRRYYYQYDRCNRFLSAGYSIFANGSWETSPENDRYNITGDDNGGIGYDDNGNILSLNRFGEQNIGTPPEYGQIDELHYSSYKGNQLDALTDEANDRSPKNMPDFHEWSIGTSGEYQYDANGNLTRDDNKGITSIVYNHLNLPVEINFGPNNKIVYLYDANGRKLMKQVIHNTQSHHTDYAGGFIYEDDVLKMIITPEGRIVKNSSSTYDPQYFIKDYLGNTRVVFHHNATSGLAEAIQEDHYDPLGMKLGGLGFIADVENKFLYQGKELNNEGIDFRDNSQTDIYLNWYDFEARNYDPQIGRWHVPDPANQTASPYSAMGNNPILNIDPTGCAYEGYDLSRYLQQMRLSASSEIFLQSGQGEGEYHGELWQDYLDCLYGRGKYGLAGPAVSALGKVMNDQGVWISDLGINTGGDWVSYSEIKGAMAGTSNMQVGWSQCPETKNVSSWLISYLSTRTLVFSDILGGLRYMNHQQKLIHRELFAWHVNSEQEQELLIVLPFFANAETCGVADYFPFVNGKVNVFGQRYSILNMVHTHPDFYNPNNKLGISSQDMNVKNLTGLPNTIPFWLIMFDQVWDVVNPVDYYPNKKYHL